MPLVLPKLSGKRASKDLTSIFELFTHGCVSNRDDWVYAESVPALQAKIKEYVSVFNHTQDSIPRPLPAEWEKKLDYSIKWTQDARRLFERGDRLKFRPANIILSTYRPYVQRSFYYSDDMNWSLYRMRRVFPEGNVENRVIVFSDPTSQKPFMALSSDKDGTT